MHESLNLEKIESEEAKRARMNLIWRNESIKFNINGVELSLKDCYKKSIENSENTFKETRKVALGNIPDGKYILYVNSTINTIAKHKNIKHIDEDRLSQFYRAETGSNIIDPDNFQKNNMMHCLGLVESDNKLRSVELSKEGIPSDLSDCVGIIFSGSEVNVEGDLEIEHIEILKKARGIAGNASELCVPQLGICFGGQMLAVHAGGEVGSIFDESGKAKRVMGITPVIHRGFNNANMNSLEGSFYVAQNHGQEIIKETLPSNASILAFSDKGGVEMVLFPDSNIFSVQFHPEVDPTRLDLFASLNDTDQNRAEFFSKDLNKIRSLLFPDFLNTVGYSEEIHV